MVVGGRELIDTLWNVNFSPAQPFVARLRINRYIMECKSACIASATSQAIELIDTLWNVNLNENTKQMTELRINRYIMECK